MRESSSVDLPVPSSVVAPFVDDLARYPEWMPLVHSAVPDGDGAWTVELRAKVGVFARSKRLRMARTVAEPGRVVFERSETDGRVHAPWTLGVSIIDRDGGCTVTMELHYGGTLWTAGILDRMLAHHIDEGRRGLAAVVAR